MIKNQLQLGSSSNRYARRLPNKKQNQLQNSFLRRTQFWVRKTFSKPASLRASLAFPSQNVQNTTCSRHFWRFRCGTSARRCGAKHFFEKHRGSDHFLTLRCRFPFASLDYTTVHYTAFHYIHYITPDYIPQHYNYNYTTTIHYTTL